MLLSQAYVGSNYTRWERKAATARALQEENAYILPVRFDDVHTPWLGFGHRLPRCSRTVCGEALPTARRQDGGLRVWEPAFRTRSWHIYPTGFVTIVLVKDRSHPDPC